ncbi:hypothetical protein PG987_000615 [Apiospora arundinis]
MDYFVSIDTWEEVLDTPPAISLVRTGDSWAARLATLAVILKTQDTPRRTIADYDKCRPTGDDEEENQEAGELEQPGNLTQPGSPLGIGAHLSARVVVLENRKDPFFIIT